MLLNWYAIQKDVEARQAQAVLRAEAARLLTEARRGTEQGRRPPTQHRLAGRGALRTAFGRLIPALGVVLGRGIPSDGSGAGSPSAQ